MTDDPQDRPTLADDWLQLVKNELGQTHLRFDELTLATLDQQRKVIRSEAEGIHVNWRRPTWEVGFVQGVSSTLAMLQAPAHSGMRRILALVDQIEDPSPEESLEILRGFGILSLMGWSCGLGPDPKK